MFTRLLRSPVLYDIVQVLAGERLLRRRLARHIEGLSAAARVLDIGGGTGLVSDGPWGRYVCLDLEPEKVRGFRAKRPGGLAVVADAAACPFGEGAFDAALCLKVIHHLNDAELGAVLDDASRVLKPGGRLIVADLVRSRRWIPRLLWRLDRGAQARTAGQIRDALAARFESVSCEQFRLAIFHEFVLCEARRGV